VWDLNKTGTFAVLEFCRKRGSKLVYAGSSTKFADGGLGRDGSPYAWTKATNTELVKNYGVWFGLNYAIVYFYNVFGGRERGVGPFATLIGIYKEEYRSGHPLTVVLPGTQQRNFTHVEDIVDGLILVGEKGEGDGYGIGNPHAYSIMDVAKMFATSIVTLPPRKGNRTSSDVETEKLIALGWKAQRQLAEDIKAFVANTPKRETREKNILVFATTFAPHAGPAECALEKLMTDMPDVHFDIVTTRFSSATLAKESFGTNGVIHRVGFGNRFDKYLLPFLGPKKAKELAKEKPYLFSWSILASYAGLAGLRSKKSTHLPFLLTLADQRIDNIPLYLRTLLKLLLTEADQVHTSSGEQAKHVLSLGKRMRAKKSLGQGDAFANQVRFSYSATLQGVLAKNK
jgi:hypothetical protein